MTTGRIKQAFDKAASDNRAALVTFIVAGDPDIETTKAVLTALPAAGADIIEVGMPFSDPMADGPVIEAASKRALANGIRTKDILALVKSFREGDDSTPVILMGYYNPIYHYGVKDFCRDAAECGVDGMIVVDLPPEEEQEMRPLLAEDDLSLIRLIAPTSSEERVAKITKSASGFVYYISFTGITGASSLDTEPLKDKLYMLRQHTPVPVVVGFGIKTVQHVKAVAAHADGVVVGSALVQVIASANDKKDAVQAARTFVKELAGGLKKVG
ncbi:MAG: tryptophan synthase subunit alpha [Alphaproteobacteria bacterium]